MATPEEKAAHGERLVVAMAKKPISTKVLAETLGVNIKTVGNWRGGRNMPDPEDLVRLERILGPYNIEGDPVEVAIKHSELIAWRQNAVLTEYQRQLHEQRREEVG